MHMEHRLIHHHAHPHGVTRTSRLRIYAATLFLALHHAIVVYINSDYLKQYLPDQYIGLLYVLGASLTILFFGLIPRFFSRYGAYRTTITLIIAEMAALIGLFSADSLSWAVTVFIIHVSMQPLLWYCFDVFLERSTTNKRTGITRSIYLTISSSIFVLAPVFVGNIVSGASLAVPYAISAIALIPTLFIVAREFKKIDVKSHDDIHFSHSVKAFFANKNVRIIFIADFILQFFYAIMVVYMPLYLIYHKGFSWAEVGGIFTIMLLPFVLTQIPMGKLADEKLGEKEILITGFVIAAASVFLIPFVGGSGEVLIWALLLFITRIGAAFIEIACETYFFKQVSAKQTNYISLFRSAIPLAYIVAPALGSIIVAQFWYTGLFSFLGVVLVIGLFASLKLQDTK